MFKAQLKNINSFFILIVILNLNIIYAQGDVWKCLYIQNCHRCPELKTCEICDKGYIQNANKTMCLPLSSSMNPFSSSQTSNNLNQSLSPAIQSNQDMPLNNTNTTTDSSNKNLFKDKTNGQMVNLPISSKDLEDPKTSKFLKILPIILLIILIVAVIVVVVYSIAKRNMNKSTYFYDENGEQEGSARVVYIR